MGKVKRNGGIKQNTTEINEKTVLAPDGGWGWVVVFSSLVCNILVDGIGLAYGVLLPKFAEHFQASKSKVSLVGSLMIGTYMCTGPLAGGLINKYGCRVVTIIGSIISTIGVIAGAFSPSLDVLILLYGVIGGLGFGMMYLPSIVSVGIYFDKRRPIATGIGVCGSGIGTFIFSPVLELLSEEYNWRGVLIIIAGIILNGCVCGILIRPLQRHPAESSISTDSDTEKNKILINNTISHNEANYTKHKEIQGDLYSEELQPFLILEQPVKKTGNILQENRKTKSLNDISDCQGNVSKLSNQTSQNVNIDFKSMPALTFSWSTEFKPRPSCLEEFLNVISLALETLNDIFDFSLLLNASFILIFFGNIFGASAYYITFMYIVDRALLLGIPSTQAALLLSVIGIMNIIGRVLSGLIANHKKVNALLFNNVALLVASLTLFLQPLCTVYPLLVVFCVVFGLAVASYVSLTSIILCDILGVDRLANSFGLLGIARGFASVIGPYVAGMVFQATGQYDGSFYLGGGMFLMAAILHFLIFIPCVKHSLN